MFVESLESIREKGNMNLNKQTTTQCLGFRERFAHSDHAHFSLNLSSFPLKVRMMKYIQVWMIRFPKSQFLSLFLSPPPPPAFLASWKVEKVVQFILSSNIYCLKTYPLHHPLETPACV